MHAYSLIVQHFMNNKRTCFRVRIADIPSVGNYEIRGKKTKFSVIYEDAKEKGRYTYEDRNGIRDKHMKTGIMKNIEQILKGNEDVNMVHLFSMLHWRVRKSIKHHLCMDTIKKLSCFCLDKKLKIYFTGKLNR